LGCIILTFLSSASESALPAKFPLHADAAAKAELFRERYTILHQVIMSFNYTSLTVDINEINKNSLV